MSLFISRVQINNFRNFKELDTNLCKKAVIVGENQAGKTNFIHALRLILDPDLPDSARMLKQEDFWDGLQAPTESGIEISISIDLQGFEENKVLLAILSDYLIDIKDIPTARITYKYAPTPNLRENSDAQPSENYDFIVYGGDNPANVFGYQQRKWIPLQVLPALRNAETDLESWRRSPLRPLIDRLKIESQDLKSAADKIDDATSEILSLEGLRSLNQDIEHRLVEMVGEFHSVSPTLGVASTDALRLLRSLRLFVDGEHRRSIAEASLGICNILYLTLLMLELERKDAVGERGSTILAIEEPEAHLHPHLQRLVYRDFLRRDSSVILTTHSPHIVSVSPIESIVVLKNSGDPDHSKAFSTAKVEFTETQIQDLERYLDATRGEMMFARGIILVEGDAELYIIPAFAKALEHTLDQLGISVCSVQGTDFAPYIRLLGTQALNIPFVVVTDGDLYEKSGETLYRGITRGIKLAELSVQQPNAVDELKQLFKMRKWVELRKDLSRFGIYIGEHTLEIDLASSGNKEEMLNAFRELGAGETRIKIFKAALFNNKCLSEEDISEIARLIEVFGKGRYAQRLVPKLKPSGVPQYIKGAIEHIVARMGVET